MKGKIRPNRNPKTYPIAAASAVKTVPTWHMAVMSHSGHVIYDIWVMSHVRPVTYNRRECRQYRPDLSQMSGVTHESRHILVILYTSHFTHELCHKWVLSRMIHVVYGSHECSQYCTDLCVCVCVCACVWCWWGAGGVTDSDSNTRTIQLNVLTQTQAHTHTQTHIRINTHTHAHTTTHTHTHTHAYKHVHIYKHTHTHTQTHT